jgi:hypothetical protein
VQLKAPALGKPVLVMRDNGAPAGAAPAGGCAMMSAYGRSASRYGDGLRPHALSRPSPQWHDGVVIDAAIETEAEA